MSLNAAALKLLAAKGLSAQDIVELAEALESTAQRSSAAVRQARYRDKRRDERDVTRNVTHPPKEQDQTPHSVSDETGGEPPAVDPVAEMFDLGVTMLKSQGVEAKQARSIVGRWRKGGRQDGEIVAALVEAKQRAVTNLVEWMPKRLNGSGRGNDPPSYMDHLLSKQPAGAHQ
jgi:hypothetical protein